MRDSVIIVLTAIVLLAEALAAHAEVGGSVTKPAVGTANPAPPAAGSDVGAIPPQKPALNGNSALGKNGNVVDNQAGPAAIGADTSTAAPGGRAESSANGALSTPSNQATPPDGKPIHPNHHKKKPATGTDDDGSK